MQDRFLVTGALGFIGAWVVRQLVEEGTAVTALDIGGSDHRLRSVVGEERLGAIDRVDCDITDLDAVSGVVAGRAITHIVHLAALQVPFCRANPSLGAKVNVVGTVNVLEAARASTTIAGPVAYASSVAAYDATDVPADSIAGREPSGHARTLYGAYKLAAEAIARVYRDDWGIPSIGLRPYTVYGVGRDQGLTSSPTFAMLAAAIGRPWTISFSGPTQMQYARDVAAAFIAAARAPFDGADVLNLAGASADMTEVAAAIAAAVPALRGAVDVAGPQLPFPPQVDGARLGQVLGPLEETPLRQGVAETIAQFRSLVDAGTFDADAVLAKGV